jgi:hypothetical protein
MSDTVTFVGMDTPPAHSDKAMTLWRDCFSPLSFWSPEYIVESAWLEHAPFGFWLIGALRPRTIVELGTHSGFSYFTFCQAVKALQLDTRCSAVDTWQGDEYTRAYRGGIFGKVMRHNDGRYSSFSTLLRLTFDDALHRFGDHTIDLLHIDGRHGYDHVRHDFESWRPKLSQQSVVLFHDTHDRKPGFGVFQLWDELRRDYKHFSFLHGHGLGVLGTGTRLAEVVPAANALFLAGQDGEAATHVRAAYARLGAAISQQQWYTQNKLRALRRYIGILRHGPE